MTPSDITRLDAHLDALHLSHVKSHYQAFATTAAQKQISHLAYLAELIEGEASARETRAIARRIRQARFPVLKTMDDFEWNWPKKINRPQIQNLFRLAFIASNTNAVFISTVASAKPTAPSPLAMPPASAATPCSSPLPSTSSIRWPPRNPPAA